jgi:ubiquinol-cytochrome c reductase cytochrome b subunit
MKQLKLVWQWLDDRIGISETFLPLIKHPVPPGAKWAYVFGSATLFTFILQVITGVALALLYQPTSETAYESLKYITQQVPLGNILRGIHYFGASAMIVLVGIHMIRVYLWAAYKYPREMSWISGIALLGLTVAMGFTGQLLRWDSNGVWSAIVAAEQAGRIPFIGDLVAHFLLAGKTLGGATLSRFFAFHVFLIPALLFGLIGLHVFLVFRNGISEPPEAGKPVNPDTYKSEYDSMLKKKGVPFWPNAAWRDMLFGASVVFIILLLAVIVGPPKIGAPPDPANIQSNPRPDWYFLWYFALFALMPQWLEDYAIVFGPLLAGLVLFLLPLFYGKGERSPMRRPWSVGIVIFVLTMVFTLWHEGIKSPWSPDFNTKPLPKNVIGSIAPQAQHGAQLFYKKGCQFCHSISGHGGHRGPDLTTVAQRLNKEEMTIRIVNGGGNMPAFGATLSNEELQDLVRFLQTRKHELKNEKLRSE